jgi:hypothetical protein
MLGLTSAALLGGGAKAAGNAASTWYTNRQSQKRQREAQDFSAQQYAKRYQTQVADLKKAGLNPMLAVSQSPGSAPQGSAAPVQNPEVGSSFASGAEQASNLRKAKYETQNLEKVGFNLDGTFYTIQNEVKKGQREIENLEQLIKNNKATEDQIKQYTLLQEKQKFLVDKQIQVQQQILNMNRPEEIASANQASVFAAEISRALKPLIDALGGVKNLTK